MFSRKKPEPAKRRNHDLSQFGFTDIPDDFDPSGGLGDDDGGDSDLEAELAAIAAGGGVKPKPKPKPKLMPAMDLNRMVADSLRDIGSDEEFSGDENDPDLLGELQGIAGPEAEEEETLVTNEDDDSPPTLLLPTTAVDTVSIIKQRLAMYKQAEQNAQAAGESGKARRFTRGLKTLNDLLKQATAGKQINVDDIPPEVSVKPAAAPADDTGSEAPMVPKRTAPPLPTPAATVETSNTEETPEPEEPPAPAEASEPTQVENPILAQLAARQQEYKVAALNYKRAGDTTNALQFLKVVKQFDMVMKMCSDGQEVDLSDMPPPPSEFLAFLAQMQEAATPAAETPVVIEAPTATETTDDAASPATMLDALIQRLDKYKAVEEAAKAESNTSKARRFGRIVKQYEDAIKLYKAGRPVPYDELPVPPGMGPLPTETNASPSTASTLTPAAPPPVPPRAAATPEAVAETTPKSPPSPTRHELTSRTSGNQTTTNLAEQQMKTLLERQQEFKLAAIEAKKAGEIEQAKEYLKIYKGFDALLNAASSGLPVDLNTLPVPPSQRENLEASFAIVSSEECDPNDDICEIGVRIEEQLAKQLMMCKNTRDHHKAMGDIAGMNRFENLAVTVQKDLDLVRYSKRKNFPLPKFHYEQKSFNIVHCNTDITDNELEIVVVRGINYNVSNPKDVDTYVRVEFPLLNDEVFKTKTTVIKDTDSPDYDQRFIVEIQRSNRQFQRIFKRHGVKCEVYARGGFLRSDIFIGSVNVKLQPLETKCDVHDTFNLMDGRKVVGGKLEVKLRVRNPILTKQMEHINEKWLVLDA